MAKRFYVALSGTPISLRRRNWMRTANPIFEKGKDDDDDAKNADKSADGIGVVDVCAKEVSSENLRWLGPRASLG